MQADYTAKMHDDQYAMDVEVAPRFLDDQSAPEDGRFAFAYTIRIRNTGRLPAQLMGRHWIITDARGHIILGISGVWMSIGLLVMRNMINFEI